MKKNEFLITALLSIIVLGCAFYACAPDYETDFNVEKLEVPYRQLAPISFPIEGGTKTITVETNIDVDKWTAASNASWCKVEKNNDNVVVTAIENTMHQFREALITIAYGHQTHNIKVFQTGKEAIILVNGKRKGVIYEIEATQEELDVVVTSNLQLDNILIPDTVSWVSIDHSINTNVRETKAVEKNLKFNIEQNTDTVVRYCKVILQSSQNYEHITSFIIKQKRRGYIVDCEPGSRNFTVPATGQVISIPFKANGPVDNAYLYEIEASAKDWIQPTTSTTRAMRSVQEQFQILPNTNLNERVGHITFTSSDPNENSSFVVTITQEAYIPVAPSNVENVTALAGDGFIMLNWDMPNVVDFTTMSISYYDPIRKKEIIKNIPNNTTTQYKIDKTYQVAGEYSFTIRTYGPTGLVTNNPVLVKGSSNPSPKYIPIALQKEMLFTNAQEPSEGPIKDLIDNNVNTYFHSVWSRSINETHYFQITLHEPIKGCKFWYKNRNNGNGKPKHVKIKVSENGESWRDLADITEGMPASPASEYESSDYLDTATFKIFRFLVEETNTGAAPTYFNMAEFKLYRLNIEDEDWAKAQQ